MTEWAVFLAIRHTLQPLLDVGFTITRHGDDVFVGAAGECRFIPARELIDDGDPCGLVMSRFGL